MFDHIDSCYNVNDTIFSLFYFTDQYKDSNSTRENYIFMMAKETFYNVI